MKDKHYILPTDHMLYEKKLQGQGDWIQFQQYMS